MAENLMKQGDSVNVAWSEGGGGIIYAIEYQFILFEVPLYGGTPNLVGAFDKYEDAVKEAESWT